MATDTPNSAPASAQESKAPSAIEEQETKNARLRAELAEVENERLTDEQSELEARKMKKLKAEEKQIQGELDYKKRLRNARKGKNTEVSTGSTETQAGTNEAEGNSGTPASPAGSPAVPQSPVGNGNQGENSSASGKAK